MEIIETDLPGVLIVKPKRHGDNRGYFVETWNRETLRDLGIDLDFVQDNQSFSDHAGTIRGLHFQAPPAAQDKLVRCGRGHLFDVAVDIRRGSPTYGRWTGVELSAENGVQLLIPKGFLHGFVTREPGTEIIYKCSAGYSPETEGVVHPGDPTLAIDWGCPMADAILSQKDAHAQSFAALDTPFDWETTA